MTATSRIARFSLTSADPDRLAHFYVAALGFEPAGATRASAAPYGVAGNAAIHRLRLGAQEIELVGFDHPGRPYPPDSGSHDGWFQHLALVAADMAAAHGRLAATPGWTPITTGGRPVPLPESSGGVTAFKFRDPEGHPLELLAFPPGRVPPHWARVRGSVPCISIDHSAIAVADTGRSRAFYEQLGLSVSARSLNEGPAQSALDAAPGVRVAVTGLAPPAAPPHLELLAYHAPPLREGVAAPADVACTRSLMVPSTPGEAGQMLADPDGHQVLLVDA